MHLQINSQDRATLRRGPDPADISGGMGLGGRFGVRF